jgi:hypothetical protein
MTSRSTRSLEDQIVAWIKVTDPAGNPVQLSADQLVRVRTAQPGEVDPKAKAIIDLANSQLQATIETADEIMSLILPAGAKAALKRQKTS